MRRARRLISCAAASAIFATGLPQLAYAAPADSSPSGKGIVDTVAGWFTGDDGDGEDGPERAGELATGDAVPRREKLPAAKRSVEPERVRELAGRRTANARFWRMSDGRVQAEVSQVPTSYPVGKDGWKRIDTEVRKADRGRAEFANTTNVARSYFGTDPGELIRYEAAGGQSVTLGLKGAGLSAPKAEDNQVSYRDRASGAEFVYTVGAGALKEDIVLAKRPGAPLSWTFSLDAEGLVPKQLKGGAIAFHAPGVAEPVLVMPAPYMKDSRDAAKSPYGKAYSTAVEQELERAGEGWRIRLTPSASWLAADERAYPVTIDPSLEVSGPGLNPEAPVDDLTQTHAVTIRSSRTGENFQALQQVQVGGYDGGVSRGLVKFRLPELPAGTKVQDAELKLFDEGSHTTNANAVTVEAHRALKGWSESSVTWGTFGSADIGELSGDSVVIDDGDPGTAAQGAWTRISGALNNIGSDYTFNKNSATGETYTWQPQLPVSGEYRVDAHYNKLSDSTTAAPYTVNYDGGSKTHTVDQTAAAGGVWTTLGTHRFTAGNTGKVVLGDVADSTKRTSADAIRFTRPATQTKTKDDPGQRWHTFPVTDTVQSWVNGTHNNYGFVLKAATEAGLTGGPSYAAATPFNGDQSVNPKLTFTYGSPGASLKPPTTIRGTGADLQWSEYQGEDIAEYQVHRSLNAKFTPSASTLVAPVGTTTTTYADHTAPATPADAPDPRANVVYYQVAVKTTDGRLLPGTIVPVRLPKAGRVIEYLPATGDATLASATPDTNYDTIGGAPRLGAGAADPALGETRSALAFGTAAESLPAGARVLDAQLELWNAGGTADGDLQAAEQLTRDFAPSTTTWNRASGTTAWTTPGGDYTDTSPGGSALTARRNAIPVTSAVQSWINDTASNRGLLVRNGQDGSAKYGYFHSTEAADASLRPRIAVTYLEKTSDFTYYAPSTAARMIPSDTYTVDVTVTNTTASVWPADKQLLSYRWTLPDGTSAPGAGTSLTTPLARELAPGDSVKVAAQVTAPQTGNQNANRRTQHILTWDLKDSATGAWLSETENIPGLAQKVSVEDPTSDQLGLEKFYAYTGENTGAGSSLMNNLYAGNAVWSYNAFANPGRGLNTFFRVAYNSLDTSDTVMGPGWSGQAAMPLRLGAALDFHPNPDPRTVTLTDGDGTASVFRKQDDGTWKHPAGVHYRLTQNTATDCTPDKDDAPDAWTLTRPDRTRFDFGCDGYLNTVTDKNSNTLTFTYEERHSNNKPTKFLRYITDPAGRITLKADYYDKGEDYSYIDDAGNKVNGTKLTNPKIIDHLKSVTDISDRKLSFVYSDEGLMSWMTDGDGTQEAKTFKFAYDAEQGGKNVKLVSVTDPRNNATKLDYYEPSEGDDPKFHWATQTITDRLDQTTGFVPTDPDGPQGSTIQTKVTDAENHTSTYVMDGFGRPTQVTNAKTETTKLEWDEDNNVNRLTENNNAATTWTYDPKTGYPLQMKDAEANKNGTAPTTYTYKLLEDGHVADLATKTSPEGRKWAFDYDAFGNLTSVTDPKGTATSTAGDYETTYAYDTFGQLTQARDANDNPPTVNSDFDPNGYPRQISDPKGNPTRFVYDDRGQVTAVTDARNKTTTQEYDVFGRPGLNKAPLDQAAGQFITTPAPQYDANDNVEESYAPNGAVSIATYDAGDQVTTATAPDNNHTADRKTAYTYDRVGNLKTTTEPKGVATPTNPDDYVTTNTYDVIYQLADVVNADGDKLSYRYDGVGNATHVIDPRKNETSDTSDFTSKTDYDLNHRPTTVTDAAGETTSQTYDLDSLVLTSTDQAGHTTEAVNDDRGMPVEVKTPYDTNTVRTTRYHYDQVGNTTKVESPRGVATTGTTEDFAVRTSYDELNRPKKQFQPYDPNDDRYNSPNVFTETFYDPVGNVERVSAPPSAGAGQPRNDTSYTHYDTGWIKTATDPWDIETEYKYNELGQQTANTLTSAGDSSARTMFWTYYRDGSLASRKDDGVPAGQQTVLVDNSDTQNTSSTGDWGASPLKADTRASQGYNHHTSSPGTDGSFTWTLNIPESGDYTAYAKYPKTAGAGTGAYEVNHAKGKTSKRLDQSTKTSSWASLGTYSFKQGNKGQITLTGESGTVTADAIKLVRDNPAALDEEQKNFAYRYDINGNLTDIDDTSSGAKIDAYTMAYTGLNQVAKVTENLAGEEKKATAFTYDANGQTETLTHPDEYQAYTYDLRNLVDTVKVGDTAADPTKKTTSYSYTPRGQKLQETKANGNVVDYTYYANQALKTTTENNYDTLVASHAYDWDPNGNKAKDVAQKMNADADQSPPTLDSTTSYTYDPVDRIKEVTKTGNGAGTESYVHDDNANIVRQSVKNVDTTYTYDRNRLTSATTEGAEATYNYDPYGRLDTVTSAGQIIERSTYDGFDHVAEHTKRQDDGTTKTTTYAYDPLDRTTSKTDNAGKTTDYNYLGLSNEVLNESVGGKVTKSYQYSPFGERLSQIKHNNDGTQDLGVYGYNSHTDVDTVTGQDGNTDATYGYTAYGKDDESEFTGADKPDATTPGQEAYNPYRFNAKRWDTASGTYDMGFRDYSPDLNRFLTRDMYNGALADMNLGTDPYTGNRYAFTSGNPTTFIEIDGHFGFGDLAGALKDEGSDALSSGVDAAADVYGNAARCLTGDGGSCKESGKNLLENQPLNAGYQAAKGVVESGDELLNLMAAGAWENVLATVTVEFVAAAVSKGASRRLNSARGGDGGDTAPTTRSAGQSSCPGPRNSFMPGTAVLMADGTTKRIEDVEAGDEVLATDPETGETTTETVTAEIKGDGAKNLVKITLDIDGARGDKTATVTATDGHPFWVPELGEWIEATDLHRGQWLRTSAGTHIQITAIKRWTTQATVYNLTVTDKHTYYVFAGETPVLVHNSNCGPSTGPTRMYVAGRPGTDTTPQTPLPESAVISRGENLQDGNYHYAVMPGGSVRAFHENVFDGGVWAGHTSLSGGGPVAMAGTFDVSNGAITKFDNFSGHYRPDGSGMESVARDALNRNGFNLGGARWDPFSFG